MQTTRTPYSISFMATVLLLLLFACHSTVANAAVALGATRVIYPANHLQKNMCRTTAHAHHFRIVWPTHQLSLMLVSNICHSPFRKFMLAEWLAAMFLLNCGKKE